MVSKYEVMHLDETHTKQGKAVTRNSTDTMMKFAGKHDSQEGKCQRKTNGKSFADILSVLHRGQCTDGPKTHLAFNMGLLLVIGAVFFIPNFLFTMHLYSQVNAIYNSKGPNLTSELTSAHRDQDIRIMVDTIMADNKHFRSVQEKLGTLQGKMANTELLKDNITSAEAEILRLQNNMTDTNVEVRRQNQDMSTQIRTLQENIAQVDSLRHTVSNTTDVQAEQLQTLHNRVENINQSLEVLPLGSIIPWLPTPQNDRQQPYESIPDGWMECNGSTISAGPWSNLQVPNLNDHANGLGLFLRGSTRNLAGQIEKDAIQVHIHEDRGHTHLDRGHLHLDNGHTHRDAGHNHGGRTFVSRTTQQRLSRGIYTSVSRSYSQTFPTDYADIQSSKANIQRSSADIQIGKASLGVPSGPDVRTAEETRPSNMRVVWIIKVQHAANIKPSSTA